MEEFTLGIILDFVREHELWSYLGSFILGTIVMHIIWRFWWRDPYVKKLLEDITLRDKEIHELRGQLGDTYKGITSWFGPLTVLMVILLLVLVSAASWYHGRNYAISLVSGGSAASEEEIASMREEIASKDEYISQLTAQIESNNESLETLRARVELLTTHKDEEQTGLDDDTANDILRELQRAGSLVDGMK